METKNLLLKVILPIAVVFVLIMLVVAVTKNKVARTPSIQQPAQDQSGQNGTQRKHGENPSEKVKSSIKDTKELYGKIVGIFDPSVGDVRFLTVESSVIEIEKLEGMDLSKGQSSLPTTKKQYEVAVDSDTRFESGAKEDLKVLDFIQATSVEGIYNVEKFTATYVNILTPSNISE